MSTLQQELEIINNRRSGTDSTAAGDNGDILGLMLHGHYEDVLQTPAGQTILGKNVHTTSSDIDAAISQGIKAFLQDATEDDRQQRLFTVLCVGVSCLQLFRQNNWVGPPTKIDPQQLLATHFSDMGKTKLDEIVSQDLSVDGDMIYNLAVYPLYLLLARSILLNQRDLLKPCQTSDWWLMRCLQTHQALLGDRSPTLKDAVQIITQEVPKVEPLATDEANRQTMMLFHIEAGHLLYFYYEPSEAKAHFNTARKLSGLDVQLTGVMGKRTKFQQDDKAQLVLSVERQESVTPVTGLDAGSVEGVDKPEVPKDVALDDDTVLNHVQLTDPNQITSTRLSGAEQALILALCHMHRKMHESVGEILREESLAYITYVLSQPQSWSVESSALLQRTYWEKGSSRRLERSMAQLEDLVAQFKQESSNPAQRLHLSYSVNLPPKWHIQKELGLLMVMIGAMNAALDIFLQLHLWDDVINCYKTLGRREKAEAVIREQLAIKETPDLWCHLGDVLEEAEHYMRAWELSECRYARAQRALALHYLRRGQFEESLPCFEKSLKLNPLQLGAWFSYGCACMACNKYEQAATAFRRCVNIETDNFEAWNNLSTAYIRLNQKTRAHASLQEAIKCDYENWRLWENFLLVSTDIGEFEDSMKAYHRMVDIKHKHADAQVLGILVRAVNENLPNAKGTPSGTLRPKLQELFGRITASLTTDADMWRLYAQLLLEGETELSQPDRERALQYLQKAHRCTIQKPGWEKEPEKCKEVAEQSCSLAQMYLRVSEKMTNATQAAQTLSSARLSIKGVLTKIQQKHTDPVSKELLSELREPCTNLESQLQKLVETIAAKREATS